jgi:protein ImuB
MYWLALHFSSLPMEIYSRGSATAEPLAIAEKLGNRSYVKVCNQLAEDGGVRTGMPVPAAQALLANLVVRNSDLSAEQEALSGIATWAGSFTPDVSLQPPQGLLIEIGSCLRLHRGFKNLIDKINSGLADMGYTASRACAPVPHAAWLLASSGREIAFRDPEKLEDIINDLPVRVLNQPPDTLNGLEMIGAYTLGDCLRLPRAGLIRRFGQELLDELDQALGRLAEPRKFFEPAATFHRNLELPSLVYEAEALLFASRRLLIEFDGYLNLCRSAVQELELVCRHEDVANTILKVSFVQPTRSLERMMLLLRETLARTSLCAPVHSLSLRAVRILEVQPANLDMFQETTEAGDGNLLLERLRIRLGKEGVHRVVPADDHRPELSWRYFATEDQTVSPSGGQRPLWLLRQPMSCRKERIMLKSGPERIESGWWDGNDVERDYYVAQGRNGSMLWVYCERNSGAWFVHGLFA